MTVKRTERRAPGVRVSATPQAPALKLQRAPRPALPRQSAHHVRHADACARAAPAPARLLPCMYILYSFALKIR